MMIFSNCRKKKLFLRKKLYWGFRLPLIVYPALTRSALPWWDWPKIRNWEDFFARNSAHKQSFLSLIRYHRDSFIITWWCSITRWNDTVQNLFQVICEEFSNNFKWPLITLCVTHLTNRAPFKWCEVQFNWISQKYSRSPINMTEILIPYKTFLHRTKSQVHITLLLHKASSRIFLIFSNEFIKNYK